MCIPLTPVLYCITTVLTKVYLQCFTESVSLRDIGKPTSSAEISSHRSLYLRAVKGARRGSALKWFRKNMVHTLNLSYKFLKKCLIAGN